MRIAEAREIAKFWQQRLGLSDWIITVRWAKKSDQCEECFGLVWWFTEEARAEIALNRQKADAETICHEIIHLRLEGHQAQPTKYSPLYEQGINQIAKLLIAGFYDL